MTAKSISIKGGGCRFGRRAAKVVELTSGGLRRAWGRDAKAERTERGSERDGEVSRGHSSFATRRNEGPVEAVRGEMEGVCDSENLKRAFRQVVGNKGSAGVDGMTVDQLRDYLKAHWP